MCSLELFDVLPLPDSCMRCVGNACLNGAFTDAWIHLALLLV